VTYAEAVNKTRVTLDVWGDMSGRIFDPHLITNDKVLGTQLIPEGFYTGKVSYIMVSVQDNAFQVR
jgi:hypothetical protein